MRPQEVTFHTRQLRGHRDQYVVFSDWYPTPFLYAGTVFACSGLALFYVKSHIYFLCDMDEKVLEFNRLMLKFYSEYVRGGTERFWTRWEEQIDLVLRCDADTGATMLRPYVTDDPLKIASMQKMALCLAKEKFTAHRTFATLLLETGDASLREIACDPGGLTTGEMLFSSTLSQEARTQCRDMSARTLDALRRTLLEQELLVDHCVGADLDVLPL